MINLLALRPSEWGKLADELSSPDRQQAFMDGLLEYLQHAIHDGGVETDRIYMAALKIENSDVLNSIGNSRLFELLKRVDEKVAIAFLSGLSTAREQALLPSLQVWHGLRRRSTMSESTDANVATLEESVMAEGSHTAEGRRDDKQQAVTRTIRVSPERLKLVAALIRGKKVDRALKELEYSRKRISGTVKKTLESVIADAESNHHLDVDSLIVSEAYIGKSTITKRFRARGRASRFEKPFSHLTIVVREVDNPNEDVKNIRAS